MFIVLPLMAFGILFLTFHKRGNGWRNSVLLAANVWGLLLTLFTETLSAFKLLTFGGLLVLWGLTTLIAGLIYWRLRKQGKKVPPAEENRKIPTFLMLLLGGISFIVAAVGLIALLAPPNNWDSMTYHMARVVHWIQNRSVDHYPAHYLPQLYLMPWSEFAIAHFQILSGGDRFANLVQWFSMIGSIIGVSLIAKELGADLRGQVLAGVFCATIPMGILQGSSTQNDYVVSFWLVCLVYYVLLTVKKRINWRYALLIGTSLGLAILTKGTAYIYAFPFMVWLLLASIKQVYWKKLWKPFFIIAFLALFLNLGYYTRNLDLFGHPLGSTQGFQNTDATQELRLTNEAHSTGLLISNVVKNLALHADIVRSLGLQHVLTPTTGVTEKIIQILHTGMGVDINDSRTTYLGNFHVPSLSTSEDLAGNPIHFFLILLLIALLISWKIFRRYRYILIYLITIIGAFLLFCFILKWQPFHSRLHLPLFVLLAACVGVVLSQLPNRQVANAVAVMLILTSLQWVFYNENRPLIGEGNVFSQSRVQQYFSARNRKDFKDDYLEVANFIRAKSCANVGLLLEDAWEYPFWVLLQQNNDQLVRFEHVNIKNVSNIKTKVHPYRDFIPCAIIHKYKDNKSPPNRELLFKNIVYTRERSFDSVSVYLERRTVQ